MKRHEPDEATRLARIAFLRSRIDSDRKELYGLEQRQEGEVLRRRNDVGIIPGVTSAQVEAAQRRRRGAAVAAAKAEKSGSAVAKAITGSQWRTLTAYAKRLKISQPALSRYVSGSLECPAEVADQVRKDFGLDDASWPRPPRR